MRFYENLSLHNIWQRHMKQITQPFPLFNPSTFTEEYQNVGSKWKNKWNKQNLQPLHAAREKSSSQK